MCCQYPLRGFSRHLLRWLSSARRARISKPHTASRYGPAVLLDDRGRGRRAVGEYVPSWWLSRPRSGRVETRRSHPPRNFTIRTQIHLPPPDKQETSIYVRIVKFFLGASRYAPSALLDDRVRPVPDVYRWLSSARRARIETTPEMISTRGLRPRLNHRT